MRSSVTKLVGVLEAEEVWTEVRELFFQVEAVEQLRSRHWQYFPVDHALTDGEVEVEAGPPQPLLLRV